MACSTFLCSEAGRMVHELGLKRVTLLYCLFFLFFDEHVQQMHNVATFHAATRGGQT
jgi:hypothetical protein